jgi:hypothetical protein
VQVRGVERYDGSFLHVIAVDDDVMMSGAFFKVWRGWDDLVAFHAEFCGEWRRHRRVVLSRVRVLVKKKKKRKVEFFVRESVVRCFEEEEEKREEEKKKHSQPLVLSNTPRSYCCS